jgi:hypothetical protein
MAWTEAIKAMPRPLMIAGFCSLITFAISATTLPMVAPEWQASMTSKILLALESAACLAIKLGSTELV